MKKAPPRYARTDKLSATQAIEYLNTTRPTFYRYVNNGIITAVQGTSPRRFRVSELDKARPTLDMGAVHSPDGVSSTEKKLDAMTDAQVVKEASSLFTQRHVEVFEQFKVSLHKILPENQEAVRAILLHLGMKHGIFEKFFDQLENGTPPAQMKIIEEWFSQVLPRQQSSKKENVPSAEWLAVIDKMDGIKQTIVNGLQPSVQLEGHVPDTEFMDAIEIAALEEPL